jgi:hypothetical protein
MGGKDSGRFGRFSALTARHHRRKVIFAYKAGLRALKRANGSAARLPRVGFPPDGLCGVLPAAERYAACSADSGAPSRGDSHERLPQDARPCARSRWDAGVSLPRMASGREPHHLAWLHLHGRHLGDLGGESVPGPGLRLAPVRVDGARHEPIARRPGRGHRTVDARAGAGPTSSRRTTGATSTSRRLRRPSRGRGSPPSANSSPSPFSGRPCARSA